MVASMIARAFPKKKKKKKKKIQFVLKGINIVCGEKAIAVSF